MFSFLLATIFAIADKGELPVDRLGRAINLDFEAASLLDWTAEGDAFEGMPIQGDTVQARRSDMRSHHTGEFWIGTYELKGDAPQGTLTSIPFKVTKPFASFLIAGGAQPTTRAELVLSETGRVVFTASGDDTEELKPVVADLSKHVGKELFIRLVDQSSAGWGHINFDDFRLHEVKPEAPVRKGASGPPDVYANAGLAPEEAARAMTVPPGFTVKLFAGEPDVVQPIAMAIDDRGRIWVAEAYSYPRRVPEDQARDRILILEDRDGDGRFDARKVFAEKLNLVSGLEVGFGGAWVGAAPNLMFIPDADGDDKPDGPPRILLDGWGFQDTHETLNTFTWGPDGWLYGCHGVFTHSLVGKPGSPAEQRTPINAGIWRYHPTRHVFEVFSQGTSNPWGLDFDAHGQCLIEACVIPHLYHMIQGGRYERQAGQHFNPFTYDDIKTIADHRHYLGATPHSGNGRSDGAGGGHAHAGLLVYLGASWPEEYRGSLFMNNIHGARLNRDLLTPRGSGFVGGHAPDFLLANDSWSQVVNLMTGPDGSVFTIDWYDKNQCHRNENELHDRTNGRIFKITYGDPKPVKPDLKALDNRDLLRRLIEPNDWYARHARRILQERGPNPDLKPALAHLAFAHPDEAMRLRGLWSLHASGNLDAEAISKGLANDAAYVRAWTIQLALEHAAPTAALRESFVALAKSDPSPVVRLYLASALQRIKPEERWAILEALTAHAEDADDPNLPLMYWYAAEPLAAVDASRAAKLAAEAKVPQLLPFMTRRIASIGSNATIALLIDQLGRTVKRVGTDRRPAEKLALLVGLNEALKGRRQVDMPAGWPKVYESLTRDKEPQVRSQARALGLTFGDPNALKSSRAVVAEADQPVADRLQALDSLLKVRDPELAPVLRGLIGDPALRSTALRGLAAYDDPASPGVIIKAYAALPAAERRDALNTLAARPGSARALLDAVSTKALPSTDLTADVIRQLRSLKDRELDALIEKVWGRVRETTADRAEAIAHYKADLARDANKPLRLKQGRAVFAKVCAQCHTLFGTGGQVGPDLTGSNRADLDYLLSNLLDPSALIGKDYQAHTVATTDGRVLNGLLKAEDKDAITLVTANETLTIPKGEIAERKLSEQSMMPDDLLKPLTWDEARDLLGYLASPRQVELPADYKPAAAPATGADSSGSKP